jgi:hypothetical protein
MFVVGQKLVPNNDFAFLKKLESDEYLSMYKYNWNNTNVRHKPVPVIFNSDHAPNKSILIIKVFLVFNNWDSKKRVSSRKFSRSIYLGC